MNLREELINEMEKSLDILNNLPLRHSSWNKQVWKFREYLEENIIEEREAILNNNHIWEENILKELSEYRLLNSGSNWTERLIFIDLYKILVVYSKSLDLSLYCNKISYYKCLNHLRFDYVKYIDKKTDKMYLSHLSDFCIKGQKARKEEIDSWRKAREHNNKTRQESLFITLIDHRGKSLKYKKSKHIALFSKEDILNWEQKVEDFFEEGYTDMQFSYDLCLPYKPLEQYYYVIKNPKLTNWKSKLMKEIKNLDK